MKITVVYHSQDYDGIFCREIALKFLPEAELIGWDYGDPQIPIPPEGTIYILDLSPDCLQDGPMGDRVIWIDHHKTALDKFGQSLLGYRIDGVAACRLAWQWFSTAKQVVELPKKEDYLSRSVPEPLAVRLAGEYDIWDHRGDGDLEFQFGLRAEEPHIQWDWLLSMEDQDRFYTQSLVTQGKAVMRYAKNQDDSVVKRQAFLRNWEGLNFLMLNAARFNSQAFAAMDSQESGHDALLGFNFNGKLWTVSMYHAAHRTDLDLCEIAKRHGGGGHRGACGFTATSLPFAL